MGSSRALGRAGWALGDKGQQHRAWGAPGDKGQQDRVWGAPGDSGTSTGFLQGMGTPGCTPGEGGHWDGHGVLQGTVRQAPGDKEVAAVPGPA